MFTANTPRKKEYDLSAIPGLGSDPDSYREPPAGPPSPPPQIAQRDPDPPIRRHAVGQSYTKDPYVEDRVLTPSIVRGISKPRNDPDSPRREFGTQTSKKLLILLDFMSFISQLRCIYFVIVA